MNGFLLLGEPRTEESEQTADPFVFERLPRVKGWRLRLRFEQWPLVTEWRRSWKRLWILVIFVVEVEVQVSRHKCHWVSAFARRTLRCDVMSAHASRSSRGWERLYVDHSGFKMKLTQIGS